MGHIFRIFEKGGPHPTMCGPRRRRRRVSFLVNIWNPFISATNRTPAEMASYGQWLGSSVTRASGGMFPGMFVQVCQTSPGSGTKTAGISV